jgi:TonB family protein
MAKPLRSEDPNPPSVQFRDFGVLNDGSRSKGATIASIVINVSLLAMVVILGYVIKTNPAIAKRIAVVTLAPQPKPEPPPKPAPRPPPPKPLPPTPTPPPKVHVPRVIEPPPEVKPLPIPQPKPVNLQPPAPPKAVHPPPAPVKVNLGVAMAASVTNHDAHPSAVRLGSPTNPLRPLTGPAVSNVSLGVAGMPGMNRGNTGNGPHATAVNMGSGSANSNNLNGRDNAVGPVRGVKLGSGTGPITSKNYAAVAPVQLGTPPPPAASRSAALSVSAATPPKVTFKPNPVYSEEAKEHHIQGNAVVSVVFRANGTMEVIGLVHGLGHGLDEPALEAARGVRFQPALDAAGHPTDFATNIIVHFIINN